MNEDRGGGFEEIDLSDEETKPVPQTTRGLSPFTQEKKARLLEVMGEKTTLLDACAEVGVLYRTVYNHISPHGACYDPEYAVKYAEARKRLDAHGIQAVESAFMGRLLDGSARCPDYVFYLVNRDPERWRNVQRHEVAHSGQIGVAFANLTEDRIVDILKARDGEAEPQDIVDAPRLALAEGSEDVTP